MSDDRLTVLHNISELVNSGLSKETLKICIELIDNGVGGRALSQIIKSIREGIQDDAGGECEDSGESAASTPRVL
ncbi:mitotic-spindle organizing protein 1 [Drosophila santomea]|uniref:mitotic-spindle organizing protein 1 n=1 Tax=Drosophila santomea TaxID=129105 RepID=UPI0019548831|nr:mitotic-spindle organizing protein 1 [Drosophila santomea]